MTREEQIKNILAFLSILFGEEEIWWHTIMNFEPDYLIEKFERYIESERVESPWGLSPSLRARTFNRYLDNYGLSHDET